MHSERIQNTHVSVQLEISRTRVSFLCKGGTGSADHGNLVDKEVVMGGEAKVVNPSDCDACQRAKFKT